MLEQIKELFALYREAVFIVDEGEIVYCNPAALKIFPGNGSVLNDAFRDDVFPRSDKNFIGELEIHGTFVKYSASKLDRFRIISILETNSAVETDDADAFSALSDEMRGYLSVMKIAADNVLPYVENLGDGKLSVYSQILSKAYYNIIRLVSNVEILGGGTGTTLVKEYFDLVSVCKKLVNSCSEIADGLSVDIIFKGDCDSLFIYADEKKIVQLVLNMISNSLLYTPSGSITLSVGKNAENVSIRLTDTGNGMPEDVKRTVWNRYETPRSLSDIKRGAGFGMAAINKIALLHGGNIILESRVEKGTVVDVSIPLNLDGRSVFMSEIETYQTDKNSQKEITLTGLSTVLSHEKYTRR